MNLSEFAAARWFSVYIVADCMRPEPRLGLLSLVEISDPHQFQLFLFLAKSHPQFILKDFDHSAFVFSAQTH